MMSRIFHRCYSSGATLKEVFIVSGARTPIGSFRQSLASVPAPMLGSHAVRAAVQRSGAKLEAIDEVFMGQVCQAGAGQAPSRQATIFAGLPVSTPTTTINKVCASGMKSIMLAATELSAGHNDVMVAGGMESMSQVPYMMRRGEPAYGGVKLEDGIVSDGLTDVYNRIHMGLCAEKTAKDLDISREQQDAYAQSSYERSQAAAKDGVFKKEIVSVDVKQRRKTTTVTADEEYARVNFAKFTKLRAAFDRAGTITAANASTLNDGAAACVVATGQAIERLGLAPPLARIVAYADAATLPVDFGVAPALAVPKLLQKARLQIKDIDLWEINEAFSVVALANLKLLNLDHSRVNIHGGAVSIGHPIGMSGARITLHLALNLEKGQKGVAAICNGGGGASAILLEGL